MWQRGTSAGSKGPNRDASTVESRWHILLLLRKFQPEIAGVSIEISRGMSELNIRHEVNKKPETLHDNVLTVMCPKLILTVGQVRNLCVVSKTAVVHVSRPRRRWLNKAQ